MHIERVQIEDRFLDGFNVLFTRGLTVVIGERGTGKTSLIELMRFCFGVQGFTPESTKRKRVHIDRWIEQLKANSRSEGRS